MFSILDKVFKQQPKPSVKNKPKTDAKPKPAAKPKEAAKPKNPVKKEVVKKKKVEPKAKTPDFFTKGINEYINIIKGVEVGDRVVDNNGNASFFRLFLSDKHQKDFGFLIIGTKSYFSTSVLKSLKNYAAQDIPMTLLLDRTIKKNEEIVSILNDFKNYPSVSISFFSRAVTHIERIVTGLKQLNTKYVCIATMLDAFNVRSAYDYYLKQTELLGDKTVLLNVDESNPNLLNSDKVIYNFKDEFELSSLSGCLFNQQKISDILAEIEHPFDSWISHVIFSKIEQSEIVINHDKLRYFRRNLPCEISVPDISYFVRDTLKLVDFYLNDYEKTSDTHELRCFTDFIVDAFDKQYNNRNRTELKTILLASGAALIASKLKSIFNNDEFEQILYKFSSVFNFDQDLKAQKLQLTHHKIINQIIEVEKNTIGVIETKFMQDLEGSILERLRSEYNVIYLTKPQYYDFHFFNCLVLRTLLQPAEYVISSNDMHRYITGGKKVVILWHGLGMLKKIAEADRVKYPLDYIVTSSLSCVEPWSDTFKVPKSNVLPFGQVQTDILFDENYKNKTREQILTKYKIPLNAKVIFFAPTFRNDLKTKEKYYDFGIDIEELSIKLEEHNYYVISKKHHVFEHILKDKGIDKSGLSNSKNGHFLIADTETFPELIAASDMFITDYSSGLFYGLAIDLPIGLYAPDVKEYSEGANGFMINYPEDLPFEFCGKADIDKFINLIETSLDNEISEEYLKFKDIHVGSCDGNVQNKIMKFLQGWNGSQFVYFIFESPKIEITDTEEENNNE